MKISASIYAYEGSRSILDVVKSLDQLYIDSFHIDCKDDISVFDDIAKIRSISNTPIDLHIITSDPYKYFEKIEQFKIEYVQFQYESLAVKHIDLPHIGGTKWGLALQGDTSIEVFDSFLDFDFIMFMTTVPGVSGGKFDKSCFRKIRNFRSKYQNKQIFVDGGVNAEVAFILRNMGVSSVVCGSFLANNFEAKALLDLRVNNVKSSYQIKDFMIDDIPLLDEENSSVVDVLRFIEDYKLGFVIFKNSLGNFVGIASNADVRRAFLKHPNDFTKITVDDIVNKSPFVLNENLTIYEMLNLIEQQNFVVNFFPVINDDSKPVGAVTFFNLIRSEI
jgi:pentose-5-phosphate-3-epimerase/CBS domain-containing protein